MASKGPVLTKVGMQDLNIHNPRPDRPVAFMCTRKQEKKADREG